MKPNFALNFTDDAVTLLHRTARGWMDVGSVAFDDPEMEAGLAYLRASALGLEPRGMTTKLVIPNSQIRYMTLPAAGPDVAGRRARIRRELEGKTPYGVDELVFDWWGTGPGLQVAVVARETLAEAEAFATAHRLNPLSFVAIPGAGQFGAEPWFGPTVLSESLLAPGEKVDRDQDPVQIAGHVPRAQLPARQADGPVAPMADPGLPPAEQTVTDEPANTIPPPDAAAEGPAQAELPEAAEEPANVMPPPDAAAGGPAQAELPETREREECVPAASDAPLTDTGTPQAGAFQSPAPGSAPVQTIAAEVTAERIPDEAESSPPVERAPQITPAIPSAKTDAAGMAIDPRPGRKAVPLPRPGARPAAQKAPDAARVSTAGPARQASFPAGGSGSTMSAAAGGDRAAAPDRPGEARKGPARTGAVMTAAGIAPPRERKPKVVHNRDSGSGPATAQAQAVAKPSVAQFGNRTVNRARPRFLGLILTVMLLLLLVAVAAWSSYLIATNLGQDDPAVAVAAVEAPTLPGPAPGGPAVADLSAATGEVLAALRHPAGFADVPVAQSDPAPAAASLPDINLAAADAAAAPRVEAATLVQPAMTAFAFPSPGVEPQDEMLLASIDPVIPKSDAVVLALPDTATDPAPLTQPAPPPFGTESPSEVNRQTLPPTAGSVTPGGVLIMAGPPPRPGVTVQPVTGPGGVVPSPASAGDAGAVPVVYADPALQEARPRLRPADMVPPEIALPDGAAEVTDAAAGRVSSLRPRARPPGLLAAEAAPQAGTAAAQAAGASLVATAGEGAASPLAIAVSRKPAARPAQANAAIEAAVSVAAADASLVPDTGTLAPVVPAPDPQPAVTADDPEAVEIDEPELASAAPSVPTRASVAKQATFRNSINLSRINLIGVYGSSSNRYAMVRQANGRFIRVTVGDRVDGGRVAAISDRELHYVKNGTTHKLAMPKG
ncbi:MAG: translation initiation factor 2 [Rhodobacter sp.]|nr:translation initiation factor 2 [Rhodobacter sp.]MCA3552061.1 translation initiation factor 2 [Rhodobacter sp.]